MAGRIHENEISTLHYVGIFHRKKSTNKITKQYLFIHYYPHILDTIYGKKTDTSSSLFTNHKKTNLIIVIKKNEDEEEEEEQEFIVYLIITG